MDTTILQLLVDGFFDPEPFVQCDQCGCQIHGDYYAPEDGGNYCLACVAIAMDTNDAEDLKNGQKK